VSLKHDGTDSTDTYLPLCKRQRVCYGQEYFDICAIDANQSLYGMAFQVRTKYMSFVNVLVLIILGNFDYFTFWPVT